MEAWWGHYRSDVPNFETDADRMEVEELTGRIPLLLRPLLRFGSHNFRTVEDNFWMEPDLLAVGKNIRDFASRTKSKGDPEYERLVWKPYACQPSC